MSTSFLSSAWTSRTALAPGRPIQLPAGLNLAAWPLAILLVLNTVLVRAFNGAPTDDFSTVYYAVRRALDGQAVYEQAYHHVDPLYLYNPGATLLLYPLGLVENFSLARGLFILVNAAAIVGALAVLACLVGHRLSSPLWPASIALAFATESVINTLTFANINGLLLLALSGFLALGLRGRAGRGGRGVGSGLWAGIVLGLAITVKPQFAPLLVLPLVKARWSTVAAGLAVPVGLNALAWPVIPDAGDYLRRLVPYLGTTRDYANSSWDGLRAYFDLPGWAYYPVWVLAAALVAVAVVLLLRWRNTDPVLWALTTTGVLLVGIFFLSSLGQQYYSMWLFPLMFTAVLPRSVFHSWLAWAAAACFLLPVTWTSTHWPDAGRWANFFLGTAGWFLLIVACAASVAGWYLGQRRSAGYTGRHDQPAH
ncbi:MULTISPECIES: glycosyltransferase family 87 protein [unclassified Corynebacterium]|uniref:glycosyltransferase family 87 protein n=1 Tax=unclassified Corynebacterium TaxID=2624378 RepID=UPI0034CEA07A